MTMSRKQTLKSRNRRARAAATTLCLFSAATCIDAFAPAGLGVQQQVHTPQLPRQRLDLQMFANDQSSGSVSDPLAFTQKKIAKIFSTIALTAGISASIMLGPAHAENELSAIYGGKGFDSSLVDQTCLVDKCSLQAKACLADDPECRKGLTCTAKCLGDNACITGCMARYGDTNLDELLKCTIEDNNCIKIAILDGGADKYGEEPRPPAPTVRNFRMNSMEGQWYKTVGFNPNYDCYACQKNTFTVPDESQGVFKGNDRLEVDVRFSMPRMMPDGTPPPPTNERENVKETDGLVFGSQSIGFNDYQTREMMVFDKQDSKSQLMNVVFGKGTNNEQSFSRTAHSQGDMFGLSKYIDLQIMVLDTFSCYTNTNNISSFNIIEFWENWYIIGENDPGQPDFKFVFYNGKTRQNTYEGAFVYSRSRELDKESMKKVYKIASDAGMNPDQFCKIRNGCFKDDAPPMGLGSPSNPFRGIIASTKISELLGVEPVAAEGVLKSTQTATAKLRLEPAAKRAWWYEVGDYLEDPHRHFRAMDSLRTLVEWPEDVKSQ